jgi:hypothetical protein
MDAQAPSSARFLYAWEIQEARRVFANGLQYEQIQLHEGADWPNSIHRIRTWLQGMPNKGTPNAITLGNQIYFPIKLLEAPVPIYHAEFHKIPWLIHELTHTWQYQHMGWRYLAKALGIQLRHGAEAYKFGGEEGLIDCFNRGWTLANFNLEQQGNIARSYYERIVQGKDVSAWLPYITEIRQGT